jgi:hypothetical protein
MSTEPAGTLDAPPAIAFLSGQRLAKGRRFPEADPVQLVGRQRAQTWLAAVGFSR